MLNSSPHVTTINIISTALMTIWALLPPVDDPLVRPHPPIHPGELRLHAEGDSDGVGELPGQQLVPLNDPEVPLTIEDPPLLPSQMGPWVLIMGVARINLMMDIQHITFRMVQSLSILFSSNILTNQTSFVHFVWRTGWTFFTRFEIDKKFKISLRCFRSFKFFRITSEVFRTVLNVSILRSKLNWLTITLWLCKKVCYHHNKNWVSGRAADWSDQS